MAPASGCPGCGLEAPADCELVYGELIGFELNHLARLGRFHQLSVDAYGAQHPDAAGSGIRLACSLVGLHLALERGMNGLQVRHLHHRMGRPDPTWPRFEIPAARGRLTVLDVVRAGARAGSVAGHARLVHSWAQEVWKDWAGQHEQVAELAGRFL